jgi:hypothetical protein
VEIGLWAKEKLDWLRGYLRLAGGIASHNTFGRIFGLIDAEQFEAAFRRWVSSILPALGAEILAIDGKTSRRSGGVDATVLHLVSAFAGGAGLVLGQRATAEKSNEITGHSRTALDPGAGRLYGHHRCYGHADRHCRGNSEPGSRLRIGGEGQPA